MTYTLSSSAQAAMLNATAQAGSTEACGLLLGQAAHIHTATIAPNIHPQPRTRFEIDPVVLIAAHRAARSGGPQVLGYWHSHPNGLAGPSPTDRAQAAGDGKVWAIVAKGAVTLWRDCPEGFVALPYTGQDG